MSRLTFRADKIAPAVRTALQSLGEPAAEDLAKYIKAECGFAIDDVKTPEELACVEKVLREVFGKAADLLIDLLHQELEK